MGTPIGSTASLAAMLARTLPTRPDTPPTPPGSQPSNAATPEADERTQEALQALDAMKQANKAMRQSAKADAKQRLIRIKQQLDILRQFCADPKVIAREAARLARQLGAAVKAYAGACGGDSNSATEAAAPTDPAQAPPSTAEEATGEAMGEATKDWLADTTPPDTAEQAGTPEDDADERETAANESFRDEAQKLFAELEQQAGEAQVDREFFSEARNVLQQIKALIASSRRRAGENGSETEDAVKAVQAAAAALDDAIPSVAAVNLTI